MSDHKPKKTRPFDRWEFTPPPPVAFSDELSSLEASLRMAFQWLSWRTEKNETVEGALDLKLKQQKDN